MMDTNLTTRDCRPCKGEGCTACNQTGQITSPSGIITSRELIEFGNQPDAKGAIGPKTRFS